MRSGRQRRFDITHASDGGMFLRRLQAEEPLGTLLYVHGLGESGLCFERLIADERLRGWNHLAVDLIGYGKSFWAAEPLTLDQHAARIAELVERTVDGPVAVLGHSMGGVIGTLLAGTLLARSDPDRVATFVNVEGNISPADCIFSSQAARYSLADWLDHGSDLLLDGLYQDQREDPVVLRPYCASIQMCDPRAFHRNAAELVEWSAAETGAAAMAAIDRPAIYFFGAPRGSGDHSRGLLAEAGVEMVGIPHAGHWPFLDQHDGFVTELLAFLDRPGARS
jgi:pimeloyl-ACP methyl ester carboxylesterase